MTSSTNDVNSWSLTPATTCAACTPVSTRCHSCSMTTPIAGTTVCWRPHRCGGKVSLIAVLCKPSPRGTRSCSKEKDDVPLSTTGRPALGSVSAPTLQLVARRCSSGFPSALPRVCRVAVRHAAAGGHPDPVAGSWLHGARPRESARRCPLQCSFRGHGEGRREKGSARQFAISPKCACARPACQTSDCDVPPP